MIDLLVTQRARWDFRHRLLGGNDKFIENLIKNECIPGYMMGEKVPESEQQRSNAYQIDIKDVLPRHKDGGVFVRYRLKNQEEFMKLENIKIPNKPKSDEDGRYIPESKRVQQDIARRNRSDPEQIQNELVAAAIAEHLIKEKSAIAFSALDTMKRLELEAQGWVGNTNPDERPRVSMLLNFIKRLRLRAEKWVDKKNPDKSKQQNSATTENDDSPHNEDRAHKFRRWFMLRQTKVFPVLGNPWLEDLNRFPSRRLHIDFTEGPQNLSQQAIYAVFRQYGKISDIVSKDPQGMCIHSAGERSEKNPSATDSMDTNTGESDTTGAHFLTPGSASVRFQSLDGAVAARNCLDGYWLDEIHHIHGREKGIRLSILYEHATRRKWIMDTLASHPKISIPLLIVILTLTVVAVFEPVRVWFIKLKITGKEDLVDRYIFWWRKPHYGDPPPPFSPTVNETERAALTKLNELLQKSDDRSIAVVGDCKEKRLLIKKHLSNRKNVLIVDCKPIAEAVDEVDTIKAAAQEVGYFPVFSTINLLSDLAVRSALGHTEAVVKPLDAQIREIMLVTRDAVKQIALRDKPQAEEGNERTNREYLAANPQARPVIIIDNFLHQENGSLIYEKVAELASELVSDLYAHVVFLTSDTAFNKSLPNPLFHKISLPAHSTDDSNKTKLPSTPVFSESTSDIWQLYIRPRGPANTSWTPEQAWHLIKNLAKKDSLEYEKVLLSDLFRRNGERVLQHLEREKLITIHTELGVPATIVTGHQVKKEDLQKLVNLEPLSLRMEWMTHKARCKYEKAKIRKREDELRVLGGSTNHPRQREKHLVADIDKRHKKIEELESRSSECKRRLNLEKKSKLNQEGKEAQDLEGEEDELDLADKERKRSGESRLWAR